MEVEELYARFRDIKHGIRARKPSTSMNFGEHKSGYKGSGYDIVGVEQWRPGQPLKDVAWNISMRTYPEKLYKIERMEPKELRTIIVCDLSYSTLFQVSQASSKALLMLDLLGNIGLTRSNVRDPVGLLGYSDRIELFMRPKLGSSQIFHMAHQIFDKLNFERQFPSKRTADLRVALDFMLARLKNRHSIVLLTDLVDIVNDPDAIDYKRLRTLGSKHDMIVLILDDPDEFRVKSRFGYIRISDMETGKQTVISARKAAAIRRRIEEVRETVVYRLKRKAGIDACVLTPDNHIAELPKFLISRTAR